MSTRRECTQNGHYHKFLPEIGQNLGNRRSRIPSPALRLMWSTARLLDGFFGGQVEERRGSRRSPVVPSGACARLVNRR